MYFNKPANLIALALIIILGNCSTSKKPEIKQEIKLKKQKIRQQTFNRLNPVNTNYLKILFAGDTHFQWRIEYMQKKNGIVYPVKSLRKLFLNADYRILNLETALTENGSPFSKKSYIFTSGRENIEFLEYLEINSAVLGNNHSMDMGQVGLAETISLLRDAGINAVGAGMNKYEAVSPLYFRIQNMNFGMLSFSSIGEEMTFSGHRRAGVSRPSLQLIKRKINEMKKHTDAIIVSLHWGIEYYVRPSKAQVKLARQIIDLGATVVIGHHPHIPQGLEVYKNGFIAYSIGNFVFGSMNNRQDHNMVLQMNFHKEKKVLSTVSIFPIVGRYRDNKDEGIRQLKAKETIGFWKDMIVQCNALVRGSEKRIRIAEDGTGLFLVR